MKNIEVEFIDNSEKIYWINEKKISNRHTGKIYPTAISNIISSKSVAVYEVKDSIRVQIAQLACVDYELLRQKYDANEFINLNYTYIDDFSWYGTNKLYEVDESIFTTIKGLSACCTFWNVKERVGLMQLNIINGDANFNYSIFYKTDFGLTNVNVLSGCLVFNNAKFWSSDLYLMGISCNKNNYFEAGIFACYTEFVNSKIDFWLLKGNLDIHFLDSEMNNCEVNVNNTNDSIGSIDIVKAKLDKLEIDFCKIAEFDARECHANLIYFKGCVFNGLCNLEIDENPEFKMESCVLNSTVRIDIPQHPLNISFENTNNNGKIYFKNLADIFNKISANNDSKQLLMLKENFRNLGDYKNEDLCYSQYRRIENKAEKSIFLKTVNFLISLISDYGTKPLRVFAFIIVLILGFSLLYYFSPFFSFRNASTFIDDVYISGITFFTVGYGDILPSNSATKIVTLIEAFSGVSTMSYFLVVLSRKIIR